MNTSHLRESDYKMKREDDNNQSKSPKLPDLTTSSWSRLKDPRIVRVSRAFGGKDRHSKVCTIKGLRDRRVRLSVPTAIQLYDLQDRLGLNQPSKAVDWLLDAAKHDIDELPPLQIPPGIFFGQNNQAMMNASSQETSANGFFPEDYWNPERSRSNIAHETSKSCEGYDQEDARNKHDHHGTFIQSNNSSSLPCLLNNVVPNSSFLKWDPSNLSLSRFGSYGSVSHDQHHDTDLLYPSLGSPPQTQSYFPSHDHRAGDDQFDPKQLNFQMLSSSTSSSSANFTPFHLSMNPKLFSSEDDAGHGLNK